MAGPACAPGIGGGVVGGLIRFGGVMPGVFLGGGFRAVLWVLPSGPCGAAFSWGLGISAFRAVWVLVGCVQSRELGTCAPRLPRFILLVSFRDTLLVVSILDIVYDFQITRCHFLQNNFLKKL